MYVSYALHTGYISWQEIPQQYLDWKEAKTKKIKTFKISKGIEEPLYSVSGNLSLKG